MVATLDYAVLLAITALTFASSYYIVIYPKSVLQRLMRVYFSEEIWKAAAGSEENREVREFSRELATIAATIGGISLAVIAFFMTGSFVNGRFITGTLSASVGVSFVMVSAMLFFWAFTQFVIVSARPRSERTSSLARGVFRYAFYCMIYGIYFFLVGFVWSLTTFSIFFSILYALSYGIVLLFSFLTVPRLHNHIKRGTDRSYSSSEGK